MDNRTAALCSLGCKVNYYESEYFAEALTALGVAVRPFGERCDIYIINSCTVTGESDRKVLQMIRRARARNPQAFIAVTGCLAQVDPARIAAVPGVDCIVGNRDKTAVLRHIRAFLDDPNARKAAAPCIEVPPFPGAGDAERPVFEPMQLTGTHHARAVVKIEDGCNAACSYCIIPMARGPARSKAPQDVLREARTLADSGYREIVLTGIELSSYDGDLPALVQEIGRIPGIRRIRLGSLDPAMLTPAWIDRLSEAEHVAPHFHISLQSGSSATLRAMRRKYNADMAMQRILYLKEKFPDAQLFADIITGFPGESDAHFTETEAFVQAVRFLHLHIFPFSPRRGTEAAALPDQIPMHVRRERAAHLLEIQKKIKRGILEETVRRAAPLQVLFETETGGHAENFIEVTLQPNGRTRDALPLRGRIMPVLPVSTDGETVTGRLATETAATETASTESAQTERLPSDIPSADA